MVPAILLLVAADAFPINEVNQSSYFLNTVYNLTLSATADELASPSPLHAHRDVTLYGSKNNALYLLYRAISAVVMMDTW